MARYTTPIAVADELPPSEAWRFAQALLARPIPRFVPVGAPAKARRNRELLEWAAQISPEAQTKLRAIQQMEEQERNAWRAAEQFARADSLITEWNEADHPRTPTGTATGGQWVTKGGGGGLGASATVKSSSILDKIIQRNRTVSELTGIVTPGMIRSTRIAAELQSAAKLPGEVARAAAAGLGTGGKAVVNGFATAVKDVATLGLNSGQLELIGVTKEDRDRGYNTAVSISTGSGQVLIAVGTGGMASALAKGGSVARTASGAIVAYDAAGNAVGVVKGVHDAANNGVTVANGAQVAAGALGISANISAAKGLIKPRATAAPMDTPAPSAPSPAPAKISTTGFRVGNHGDMPSPRPGQHSHHDLMSAWMKRGFPSYDAKNAPAVLMPDKKHRATYAVFNGWKSRMAQKMGGTFDWSKVSEADMRELSERMFDAAEVPASVRQQYWAEFERMKSALQRQQPRQSLEAWVRGEYVMSDDVHVLTAAEMQRQYGSFYAASPMTPLDKGRVPRQFWPLLAYAEFWGVADDWTREELVASAPPGARENLKRVVAAFDSALDEWLAGPAADEADPSDEYVAFSAMRIAAYSV